VTTRIRVAELSLAWGLGGTEQAIELRSRQLAQAGLDVIAIGVHAGGPRLDRLATQGVPTASLDGSYEALRAKLREFRPHVVHYSRAQRICDYSSGVQAACAAENVPVVFETNVFGRPPGAAEPRPPEYVCHMSLSSMLRSARQTGATMAQLFERGHRTVYLPVPTDALVESRNARRQELGVGTDELLACRVARPDLRKWSARLEGTLDALFRRIPQLRFLFMAAPPEKATLLRRRFGHRVLLLPPESDLNRVASTYAACDLMIHSSGIGESFGLSMAEAMSHGLPVVVDSTPAMDNAQVEVVEHGVTGYVVSSAAGFVQATELLLDSRTRASMGERARERALSMFSERAVAQQWCRLYEEGCRKRGLDVDVQRAAAALAMPGVDEYTTFEERYRAACSRTLGGSPSIGERARSTLVRARDTAGYARQLGFGQVSRVVLSRLRSSGTLRRD
jgi:hypothetical protein